MLLRRSEMTSYQAAGTRRRVEYGADSHVEVDASGRHYRVVVEGRLVSRDFTSFAPNWRGDAWLAYARDGGTLSYPAPDGWTEPTKLKAVALTQEGEGDAVPVRLEGGQVRFDAAPATPYRVTYAAPNTAPR